MTTSSSKSEVLRWQSKLRRRGISVSQKSSRVLGEPGAGVELLECLERGELTLSHCGKSSARQPLRIQKNCRCSRRDAELEGERQARLLAEAANRAKDQFLAILSHELRTPLNAIAGWAQLLRQGRVGIEQQQMVFEIIHRNALLQANLVEDLLDFSRILRGKLHCQMQPVSLATVVRSAVAAVEGQAGDKELILKLDLAEECPHLQADPLRLQQVVGNLLTNAIKFTPAGGQITVQVCKQQKEAVLLVTDTGPGIRSDLLPHLFEAFQQDEFSARRHGGLGLGLFIVRHIVEAHGGRVWAESAGEGQGATFGVELPHNSGPTIL